MDTIRIGTFFSIQPMLRSTDDALVVNEVLVRSKRQFSKHAEFDQYKMIFYSMQIGFSMFFSTYQSRIWGYEEGQKVADRLNLRLRAREKHSGTK